VALLPEGEAHVWLAKPGELQEPKQRERCLALLGPDERERYQRIRLDASRREFLAAHALGRLTLSRYAPVQPEDWTFSTGERGRPEIRGPSRAGELRFNLSHTRGMVACAVARKLPIGVDVESVTRRVRHARLAERFFGEDERRALRALAADEQPERFLEIWTLKEAYLKALGSGISIPLRSFQFRISAGDPPGIGFDPPPSTGDAGSWEFALFRPGLSHALAAAVRRPAGSRVAIRLFDAAPLDGPSTGSEPRGD
jgi:4'-phosphopantetheinyl transferase